MTANQNDMGRAFEFGLAVALAQQMGAQLVQDQSYTVANQSFNNCLALERQRIQIASSQASTFLLEEDSMLSNPGFLISIQPDHRGIEGDVRDILIQNNRSGIVEGISAKNRHFAIKHSRLSPHIDFGLDWFGINCSRIYFETISPIFNELQEIHDARGLWRDLTNKFERFYMPILEAFQTEMMRLFQTYGSEVASGLVGYLLGRNDFYKVIKENGNVTLISFNMNGTLGWGSRLRLPTSILRIYPKPGSQTTIIMAFDEGWQISFRIHNASELVEPSVKFDIQPVGFPQNLSRHIIHYLR
jgi:hypothetical protein